MKNLTVDRRVFVQGCGASAVLLPFSSSAATAPSVVISTIVDTARNYRRATDWAPRQGFGPIDKAFYCNIFVADVVREAGGATWDKIPRPLGIFPDRDPVAAEWADPTFAIKGWKVIFHPDQVTPTMTASDIFKLRQAGDVVSGAGHVGIVSDEATSESRQVWSASAVTGAVELNNWSFRLPDVSKATSAAAWQAAAVRAARQFTVRRFVGV